MAINGKDGITGIKNENLSEEIHCDYCDINEVDLGKKIIKLDESIEILGKKVFCICENCIPEGFEENHNTFHQGVGIHELDNAD